MKKSTRLPFVILAAVVVAAIAMPQFAAEAADKEAKKKRDRPLERTRETVKMLDDVYKTIVVLITTHYVNSEDDLPAGSAAIALFDAIGKKGWHQVRLIDASGEPLEDKNTAKDEFEKMAVKELKAGKGWYEEVVTKGKKRSLRAATPIPVVLKKCVMCHENYESAKANEPIGILSYTIPIK